VSTDVEIRPLPGGLVRAIEICDAGVTVDAATGTLSCVLCMPLRSE
jgi:hypothetical protein